ncbi:MAG: hypothetical protein BWY79_01689 [Actinobacteria bacterium ADurb.Bin444]|nr:MAG: hypothetical protein BWY79_01689 [Actinobacteria bacterium ADurb.Bin444]
MKENDGGHHHQTEAAREPQVSSADPQHVAEEDVREIGRICADGADQQHAQRQCCSEEDADGRILPNRPRARHKADTQRYGHSGDQGAHE